MTMIKGIRNIPAKICLVSTSIFLIPFMLGCYTEPVVERDYIVISITDLHAEFAADNAAATAKYLDQWCEVTGAVKYVGKEPRTNGKAYVVLTGDPPDQIDKARVTFRASMKETLDQYEADDWVTMRGKVIGTYTADIVFLSQGVIVE
ncbi:hypothetical protein ACFLXP_05895 [Chloroflexota bacterium]